MGLPALASKPKGRLRGPIAIGQSWGQEFHTVSPLLPPGKLGGFCGGVFVLKVVEHTLTGS